MFPAGGQGIHLVVDEKGCFRDDNFQKALAHLKSAETGPGGKLKEQKGGGKGGKGGKGKSSTQGSIYKIVKMVMERDYYPVIIFAFSKKDVESLANQMTKLDLNSDDEKDMVSQIYANAIDGLSEDDKKLPQVEHMLPILRRGIGMHHSGLLPILKEVIEILFQEGLVKALFATETFSMGLNMPAKTVVFTSVRKFDGTEFRWISGGEYIQMSGRAGRRGLDDRGIVILMVDEKMEPEVAKSMLVGVTDPLNSAFHLGYNMLLNSLRMEEFEPELLIRKSFHQYQSTKALPETQRQLEVAQQKVFDIHIEQEDDVAQYYQLKKSVANYAGMMRAIMNQPKYCLKFLNSGRIAKIMDAEGSEGVGVVIQYQKVVEKAPGTDVEGISELAQKKYVVDLLVNTSESEGDTSSAKKRTPVMPGEKGEVQVIQIPIEQLNGLSQVRVVVPQDVRSKVNRKSVGKSIRDVMKQFKDGLPMLDPTENLKIQDGSFDQAVKKVVKLESKLKDIPIVKDPRLSDLYERYEEKVKRQEYASVLEKKVKDQKGMIMKDQLKGMRRALRRLKHTSEQDVVQVKGRMACELDAGDELLVTELIVEGVFNDLTPQQAVALASCLVFDEKSEESAKIMPELDGPYNKLQECARKIADAWIDAKLDVDKEKYLEKFSPNIMELVMEWCNGAKFAEIMKLTEMFEGSIIRVIKRLEELLRQAASAAKSVGDDALEKKFNDGIAMIKRDIVFAASLYL